MAKSPPKKVAAQPALKGLGPVEIFEDVEQGSDEWMDLRLGVPTASNFHIIMADGRDGEASKTRTSLLYKLAGEILTSKPAEGDYRSKFITAAMERGKEMEPLARAHYASTHFGKLREVGFMRRKLPLGRYVGASPDGLIGEKKGLEIKTMAPHRMIPRLLKGAGMMTEHRPQVFGTMWVGNLDEVDLQLFYEGMPVAPVYNVKRDAGYIKEISDAVERFDFELNELVKKIRSMGAQQ